jgi:hypothetical protein
MNSCYKEGDYDFSNIKKDDVLKEIIFSKHSLVANSLDTLLIHVVVPDNADDSLAEISIKATLGKFLPDNTSFISGKPKLAYLNKELKRFYTAILKSETIVGNSYIEVSSAGIKRDSMIYLKRNYPDTISMVPAALALKADLLSEIEIDIILGSFNGKVSYGQPISLEATDSLGNQIGTFRSIESISSGDTCTAFFSIVPDTSYVGTITLRCTTDHPEEMIENQVIIYSYK